MNTISVEINTEAIDLATKLASKCSSAAARERVLVSQAVVLSFRRLLNERGLASQDGRSSFQRYVDLLDIADFKVNNWSVDIRAVTEVDDLGLYVPAMPLIVGILSDYYLCAKVDNELREATFLGFADRLVVGEAGLTPNGLFAIVEIEDLKPVEDLIERLRSAKEPDTMRERSFEEWQERARRVISTLDNVLSSENVFSSEQVEMLGAGLRDDILRIWGQRLPAIGLEPLFNQLFHKFGIYEPIPAASDEPIAFQNPVEGKLKANQPGTESAFFRDQLGVHERVTLYRHLLEDELASKRHRQTKRVLDQVTGGQHQTTRARRARVRMEKEDDGQPTLTSDVLSSLVLPTSFGEMESSTTSVIPAAPIIDFSADPEVVRTVTEAERLGYGHLFNPTFATEISLIQPLPHQRIAVYERILNQTRLRFLLADDAGAGKTIMTGLYIREMLTRRLLKRVLIISPAGLVGNWEREMHKLFSLPFQVIVGSDAKSRNPFIGAESNLLIVSIDTMAGDRMFRRLQEPEVTPYDLVVFDEAHKLSADREQDFSVRKTDRYRLGEALSGALSDDERWTLEWSAHHLLLLTATPHMGKQFPYFCLWRLLEPDVLSTETAFENYPREARARHFIRRSKEEMVRFDGSPIYPTRISDTQSYDLTHGEISERRLYEETTDYIQYYYNRASLLNRSAARFAMSVFQRRLASSTFALMRSFERRLQKLDDYIARIRSGEISIEDLSQRQRQLDRIRDVFEEKTADEETSEDQLEENERNEDKALGGVIAVSLAELEDERRRVEGLQQLAAAVYNDPEHEESKFAKLRELFEMPKYQSEKVIIFTEHKDTLLFLVRRLQGLGFTEQVAQIHGGMGYKDRDKMVEFFRRKILDGGARFLVATDAAGEGINLQFCWLMVNYDLPWNPARLEQRMGRIHRYGQEHDPVVIINLVSGSTREGRVMKTLLDKLERIRDEMGSDKVFDVIGRLFEGVSLKDYLERAAMSSAGEDQAKQEIEYKLTKEQVEALEEREKKLGEGGDIKRELPRLREAAEQEVYRRLVPGYVRGFLNKAAPLLNLKIEGEVEKNFSLQPTRPGALDPILPWIESYSETQVEHLTLLRPADPDASIWLHPGEPLFEALRAYFLARYGGDALRGAVFVDPDSREPYFYHLALISVQRQADPSLESLSLNEVIDYRLIGLRSGDSHIIQECPVEHLLLLRSHQRNGDGGVPLDAARIAAGANSSRDAAQQFALNSVARTLADQRRQGLLTTLAEREAFIVRGYDYQDAELANRRSLFRDRANAGDSRAKGEITKIRERQRRLARRREEAVAVVRREPELIAPGEVVFIAHALVVPSTDPKDIKRRDDEIERLAVQLARAYEEASGATIRDVSTPALALAAGLGEHPGFDLESRRIGEVPRAIEVKGRAGIGEIEVTENEWMRACNLRERYWLYVAYDCGTAHPRLLRVQDPFGKLIVRKKGGVVIDQREVLETAETD